MHGRAGEKKEPWLLIKSKDEEARGANDPDILEDEPLSVVSGRSISEIAEGKGRKRVWHSNKSVKDNVKAGATKGNAAPRRTSAGKSAQQRARRRGAAASKKSSKQSAKDNDRSAPGARLADFVPPSLAVLRATAPSGTGWAHEIKFDGYRIQARLDHGEVRLLTRKGLDWTEKFSAIAETAEKLPDCMIDGEAVALDRHGAPDFGALQVALSEGNSRDLIFFGFDLLFAGDEDLRPLPLTERKARLREPVGSPRS